MADHYEVKLTVTCRLSKELVGLIGQQALAAWMPDEYPSLAGFVADWEPVTVKAEIRDADNRLSDWTEGIEEWQTPS